jgi:hypothetical protein
MTDRDPDVEWRYGQPASGREIARKRIRCAVLIVRNRYE